MLRASQQRFGHALQRAGAATAVVYAYLVHAEQASRYNGHYVCGDSFVA